MKSMMLAAALALVSPAAAFAAPPQMEPGLWQRTMTMGTNTFIHKECVTPEMVKEGVDRMAQSDNDKEQKNCKWSGSWSGNVYSFKSECEMEEDGPTTTTGTMTFESPQHMVQVMNTTTMMGGEPQNMTMKIDHKRVGDCPK